MAAAGRMEVVIKINELPDAQEVQNGWKSFEVDCDGQLVSVTVKPKVWKKLQDAQAIFPLWVASIGGKMGTVTETGFVLENPNIQVFERKPKEPSADQPEVKADPRQEQVKPPLRIVEIRPGR